MREQVEGIQEKVDRIKKIHSDLLTSPFEAESEPHFCSFFDVF